jgi:hypothetical protein
MAIEPDWTYVTTMPGNGDLFGHVDAGYLFGTTPILGYMVYSIPFREKHRGSFHAILPVTWEQVYDHDYGRDYVIVHADGSVDEPEGSHWNSVTECRLELAERHKKLLAARIEVSTPTAGTVRT